jgi:putative exporter of polyketide antibiotics
MIYLRDVITVLDKKFILLGMVFGILGLFPEISNVKIYFIPLSVPLYLLSTISFLYSSRNVKVFNGVFKDKMTLGESFHAVQRNKHGEIVTERRK